MSGDLSSRVSVKSGAGLVTTTIAESDPITVSLSGPSTVTEGDTTTSYTVSLSPAGVTPTADLTVAYATSDGSAKAADDYTAKSGTLTFTSSDTADKTITVPTVEDNLDEPGESFTLAITSSEGGGGPAPSLSSTAKSVSTSITDNDATPSSIKLSVDPGSLAEGDKATAVMVTATLDGSSTLTSDTAVTITLGGSAGASDYGTSSLASVTIPAGQASGSETLAVTPTNDAVVEGDETIVVSGSLSGFSVAAATIKLEDDDTTELSISGPSADVAEGNSATYTVTLSKAVAKQVQVAWTDTAGTASSSDYTATPSTLTFGAGSAAGATRTFTVTATDDDLSETSETFTVALGTVTSDISSRVSVKSGAGSVTTAIAESDPITVSLSGPSTVPEGDITTAETVTTTIVDDDAPPPGQSPDPVPVAPGDPPDPVPVSPGDPPDPPRGSPAPPEDDPDPGVVVLSVSPDRLSEDDPPVVVTVTATRNGGYDPRADIVVALALAGTATSSDAFTASSLAVPDIDYTFDLTEVIIPVGETIGTTTITITPKYDGFPEDDETIIVDGTTNNGLSVAPTQITLMDYAADPQDEPDPDPDPRDPGPEPDPRDPGPDPDPREPDPEPDPREPERTPEPESEGESDTDSEPESEDESDPEPEDELEPGPSAATEGAPTPTEDNPVEGGADAGFSGEIPSTPTTQATSQANAPTVDNPVPIFVIPLLLLLAIEAWRRTRRSRNNRTNSPDDTV